MDLTAL